jgi:hypothetical protein
MSQYNQSNPATSEAAYGAYGAQNVSRGPSSASSGAYGGRGGPATTSTPTTPFPMPSIPAGVATGAAAGAGVGALSSKQREAYQEQQRFRVNNDGGPSGAPPMSPTGTSGSGGPVTVHEDGGAVGEDNGNSFGLGPEIPPT